MCKRSPEEIDQAHPSHVSVTSFIITYHSIVGVSVMMMVSVQTSEDTLTSLWLVSVYPGTDIISAISALSGTTTFTIQYTSIYS